MCQSYSKICFVRAIALILAILFMFGSCPLVLADSEPIDIYDDEHFIIALNAGSNIRLWTDIYLEIDCMSVDNAVTIDLNGYKIYTKQIRTSGTLTIKDSQYSYDNPGSGKLVVKEQTSYNAEPFGGGHDGIYGTIIIDSGVVEATGSNAHGNPGYAKSGASGGNGISGNVIINSGSLTAIGGSGCQGGVGGNAGSGGQGGSGISGTIIVNGGIVNAYGGKGGKGGQSGYNYERGKSGNGGIGGTGISGNIIAKNGNIISTGGSGGLAGSGGIGYAFGGLGGDGISGGGVITDSVITAIGGTGGNGESPYGTGGNGGNGITGTFRIIKSQYSFTGGTGGSASIHGIKGVDIGNYVKFDVVIVDFDSNGGTVVSSQQVIINSVINEPTAPTKAEYTFVGWFTAKDGGSRVLFPYNVTNDITLYAHWIPNCIITFNSMGGSVVVQQTVAPNSSIYEPPIPTKKDYAFAGWYTEANGGTKILFPYTVNADTTLYAHWNTAYLVTFDSNGGTRIDSQYVALDSDINEPIAPTRDGYVFTGWFNKKYGGSQVLFPYTIAEDTTLYAHWISNTYTLNVTFDSNGGSSVANRNVYYNTAITAPKNPILDCHKFKGWFSSAIGGERIEFPYTVTDDVILYAQWELAVEYDLNSRIIVKAPTCTEDGIMEYSCKCGKHDTYTEVLAAMGHLSSDSVIENEKAATCEVDGSYDEVVYCSVCHSELFRETKVVSAYGHLCNTKDDVVIEPTCTDEGYVISTCYVCGESIMYHDAYALGHNWDNGTITIPATCIQDGVITFICRRNSNHTYTKSIPATGHTFAEPVRENEVPATCSVAGSYDEVVYCTGCHEEIIRVKKMIPSDEQAHDWGEWVQTKAPTETEPGEETRTCKHDSSHKETREIARLPHSQIEHTFLNGEIIIIVPNDSILIGAIFDVKKIVPPPEQIINKVKNQYGSSSTVIAYYEIRLTDKDSLPIIYLNCEITIKTLMPEQYVGKNSVRIIQEDKTGKLIEMTSWWEDKYICYNTDWLEIYH